MVKNRKRSHPNFLPLPTLADSYARDVCGAFWRTLPPQIIESGMQINPCSIQLLAQCPLSSAKPHFNCSYSQKNKVYLRAASDKKSLILIKPKPCYELFDIFIYIYIIVMWLCPHPRIISPGKSNVEQETCFPALENMLRSQKHPLLQAGANPRILTSFNEIKRVK